MSGREHRENVPAPAPKPGTAPAARETGWLADCVYTGDKFETGLAFFADDRGRITRFSREPADLAAARRLAGQAALPGLVNGHSHSWQRVLRGRARPEARAVALGRLAGPDLYDTARMAFMEMMLSGITCVGEFQTLHRQPDGTPWPEPGFSSHEILRAAHDVGLRIALFTAACARAGFRQPPDPGLARCLTPTPDEFIREIDALREYVAHNHPGDDAWVGVAAGFDAGVAVGLGAEPLLATVKVAVDAGASDWLFGCAVIAGRPAGAATCPRWNWKGSR